MIAQCVFSQICTQADPTASGGQEDGRLQSCLLVQTVCNEKAVFVLWSGISKGSFAALYTSLVKLSQPPSLHMQLHHQNSELVFSTLVTYITRHLKRGVWFSYLRATSSKLHFVQEIGIFPCPQNSRNTVHATCLPALNRYKSRPLPTFKQGRQHTFNPNHFCHTYHPYIWANKKDTLITPLHLFAIPLVFAEMTPARRKPKTIAF